MLKFCALRGRSAGIKVGVAFVAFVVVASLGHSVAIAASAGYLEQTVLVILCFPPKNTAQALTSADKTHILNQLDTASDFFWANSDQALKVKFKRLTVLTKLDNADYQDYEGGKTWAAKFSKKIRKALQKRDVDPTEYAGVIFIYRPLNAPGSLINNTWIWLDDKKETLPGFSSVLFDSTEQLSEIVVHEYLHQLDHRFKEAYPETVFGRSAPFKAPNAHGFMNPDEMNEPTGQQIAGLLKTTFSEPKEYYKAILKYFLGADARLPLDKLHRVDYSRLAQVGRGTWISTK